MILITMKSSYDSCDISIYHMMPDGAAARRVARPCRQPTYQPSQNRRSPEPDHSKKEDCTPEGEPDGIRAQNVGAREELARV